jgi:hypothetical protein
MSRVRQALPEHEQRALLRAQVRLASAEQRVERERRLLSALIASLLEAGRSRRAIGEVLGRAASNVHKLGKVGSETR